VEKDAEPRQLEHKQDADDDDADVQGYDDNIEDAVAPTTMTRTATPSLSSSTRKTRARA
jgi:hypothetical protein